MGEAVAAALALTPVSIGGVISTLGGGFLMIRPNFRSRGPVVEVVAGGFGFTYGFGFGSGFLGAIGLRTGLLFPDDSLPRLTDVEGRRGVGIDIGGGGDGGEIGLVRLDETEGLLPVSVREYAEGAARSL